MKGSEVQGTKGLRVNAGSDRLLDPVPLSAGREFHKIVTRFYLFKKAHKIIDTCSKKIYVHNRCTHIINEQEGSAKMEAPMRNIIERALKVFKKGTGFEAHLQAGHFDNTKYPHGLVRIAYNNTGWYFAVEAKASVTRATAGLEKLDPLNRDEKVLLITAYVTPPIAELLKELNIFFIDAVGNAYINEPPLFVFIKGNKPLAALDAAPRRRLFKPGGLKVLFTLLNKPDMVNKSYRDIARAAGVALGTVGWIIRDLKEMGFYLEIGRGNRKLLNLDRLFKRWVEAYPEQLRPKLIRARFAADSRDWWQEVNIEDFGACWGGEVAAAKLTRYLKPEKTIIYTNEPFGKLVLKNKLRKTEHGNVEILTPFWNFDYALEKQGLAPPLLIYADLMATGDVRNIETAGTIYEKHFAGLVRENQ